MKKQSKERFILGLYPISTLFVFLCLSIPFFIYWIIPDMKDFLIKPDNLFKYIVQLIIAYNMIAVAMCLFVNIFVNIFNPLNPFNYFLWLWSRLIIFLIVAGSINSIMFGSVIGLILTFTICFLICLGYLINLASKLY